MKLTLAIPEIGHVTRRMAGESPSVMSQYKLTGSLPFQSFPGLDDKLHGQAHSCLYLPLVPARCLLCELGYPTPLGRLDANVNKG